MTSKAPKLEWVEYNIASHSHSRSAEHRCVPLDRPLYVPVVPSLWSSFTNAYTEVEENQIWRAL